MHSDIPSSPLQAPPPAVSALQQAWLREIGLERLWLPRQAEQSAGKGREQGRASTAEQPGLAGSSQAGQTASERAPSPQSTAGMPATSSRAVLDALQAAGRGRPRTQPPARSPQAPSSAPAAAQAPAEQGRPAAFGALREDRRAAVASMDFDALHQEVLACEQCGLCKQRRQAVFGTGAQPAAWLVVGEAPGEQEDRQGLPFVGRSGQLLDSMLAALGHSRQKDVYIANVIKCRPPGNRNPKPEEIAACSPYLMRQIELLRPERILVLGRFAAQTLLQTEASIGSLRGRVHHLRSPDGRDIPMVVSYHPAYLLRSPHEKARTWQDLRLAATL